MISLILFAWILNTLSAPAWIWALFLIGCSWFVAITFGEMASKMK